VTSSHEPNGSTSIQNSHPIAAISNKLDAKIATVEAAIKLYNSKLSSDAEGSSQPWFVQPETTEAEFSKVVQENGDEETAALYR
jgi:hypothetical protein